MVLTNWDYCKLRDGELANETACESERRLFDLTVSTTAEARTTNEPITHVVEARNESIVNSTTKEPTEIPSTPEAKVRFSLLVKLDFS